MFKCAGLDPAEPYFQYLPAHVRLDPTDAKFVDAIHTDGRTILLLGNFPFFIKNLFLI